MRPRRSRISAYGLILDGERILLCRLSKELLRWEGSWTLPGGGLEFGESPEAAMIREVEEETGLQVVARSIAGIDSIHDVTDSDEFHGIRILYWTEIVGGSLRNELEGSTDRCEWHSLHSVPGLRLVDLTEAGIRLVEQIRAQGPGGSAPD